MYCQRIACNMLGTLGSIILASRSPSALYESKPLYEGKLDVTPVLVIQAIAAIYMLFWSVATCCVSTSEWCNRRTNAVVSYAKPFRQLNH
jgi:hypothetical protein